MLFIARCKNDMNRSESHYSVVAALVIRIDIIDPKRLGIQLALFKGVRLPLLAYFRKKQQGGKKVPNVWPVIRRITFYGNANLPADLANGIRLNKPNRRAAGE